MDKGISGNGLEQFFSNLKIQPVAVSGDRNNCQAIIKREDLKMPVSELCSNPERITAFGEGNLCQLTGPLPGIVNLLKRVGV